MDSLTAITCGFQKFNPSKNQCSVSLEAAIEFKQRSWFFSLDGVEKSRFGESLQI